MHFASCRIAGRKTGGFTLLELLVVVAIIGLLAGYVGPRYFGQIGKAETKAALAQIDALEKALDQYRLDVGRYPATFQGLAVLMARPVGNAKWNGPYLKKDAPLDPWGKAYVYKSSGDHGDFDLLLFSQELRSLLDAGLSLIEAMGTLSRKETVAGKKSLLESLIRQLREGKPFSAATREHPNLFPPLFVALISASGRTGELAQALSRSDDELGQVGIGEGARGWDSGVER